MKDISLIILVMLLGTSAFSQYTAEGTIEYERSTNLSRIIDDLDEDERRWVDKFRSQIPKHKVAYFDLHFNMNNSIYTPGRDPDVPQKATWVGRHPAAENKVYTDFKTHTVIAQKQIYEENFLVKDTMRKIEWKVMDEVRTIANFKCRKAVGVICDSVYVVAFYTDDIMVSGGPEMFSGLPGMILQIAVPRLHTTWIATKVDIKTPDEKEFKIPKKGKESTQEDMISTIHKSIKRWGKDYADKMVWWALL